MNFDFFSMLFYFIPAFSIVIWAVLFFLYSGAKRKNKENPGSVSPQKLNTLKFFFVLSSIVFGFFVALILGFVALIYMAVAFM